MKIKTELIKDIAFALEMNGFEHYLDKNSFELISLPLDNFMDDEYTKDRMKVLKNGGKYFKVYNFTSSDNFNLMERFSGNIEDSRIRIELLNALSRKKPFANFKATLNGYPDYLEKWYKFKDEFYTEAAEDLLNRLNILI